ncbi:hypothetical protein BKA81DRAFT_359508 [Phyllosticta paracitricarpa]
MPRLHIYCTPLYTTFHLPTRSGSVPFAPASKQPTPDQKKWSGPQTALVRRCVMDLFQNVGDTLSCPSRAGIMQSSTACLSAGTALFRFCSHQRAPTAVQLPPDLGCIMIASSVAVSPRTFTHSLFSLLCHLVVELLDNVAVADCWHGSDGATKQESPAEAISGYSA